MDTPNVMAHHCKRCCMALKKCRMSFPRRRESILCVILNLFQDLL
ncbi:MULTISPECIES: hypothetical protein [unclassified Rickettsia]